MKAVQVGSGLEPGITMGPVASERRLAEMQAFVDDARATGGEVRDRRTAHRRARQLLRADRGAEPQARQQADDEEPFGPMAGIVPFDDLDDAIATRQQPALRSGGLRLHQHRRKNAPAGRPCSRPAWSTSTTSAWRRSEIPFGGIKDSGFGSEGGTETFDTYLVTKFVTQMN